jgi:dihydrofolate reductase
MSQTVLALVMAMDRQGVISNRGTLPWHPKIFRIRIAGSLPAIIDMEEKVR